MKALVVIAISGGLLAGCTVASPATTGAATSSATDTSVPTTTPSESPTPAGVPADPNLALTVDLVAKAKKNGAELHAILTVDQPVLGNSPEGKAIAARFTAKCSRPARLPAASSDRTWFTRSTLTVEHVEGTPEWPKGVHFQLSTRSRYLLFDSPTLRQHHFEEFGPTANPGVTCGYTQDPLISRPGVSTVDQSHWKNERAQPSASDEFVRNQFAFFTFTNSRDATNTFTSCTSTLTALGSSLTQNPSFPFRDYSAIPTSFSGGSFCGMGEDLMKL
jgi:hypothetical protein